LHFKRVVFPLVRGHLMVVPDSSPRAFAETVKKFCKGWKLLAGLFFPLSMCNVPWGRASAPAGVAPEAFQECVHSCKVL
jgi:hypothetical protein